MKTVVITGATSFLGRNVVKGLLDNSYMVYAFVRESSTNLKLIEKEPNLHFIYGDLDNLDNILNIISSADIFVHFAWDGSGNVGRADAMVQMKNVEYAFSALRIAEQLNCEMFIFPGSQAEYGISSTYINEDVECKPISPYGKAKKEFGEIAREYCEMKTIKFIHLRIFSVFGYGDRSGTLVDACIKKFNHGEKMEMGPCKQLWNFLYIDDFVEILLRLIASPKAEGIINIASQKTDILRNFVLQIYEMSNKSGSYSFEYAITRPEGTPELNPDIAKLKSLVGDVLEVPFQDAVIRIMHKMEHSC